MSGTWIDRLRQADQQRASFPGEHWLVATAGMWLLRRRGLLGKAAGAALLYRAASGRDGLRRLLGEGGVQRPAAQRRLTGGTAAGPRPDAGATSRPRCAPDGPQLRFTSVGDLSRARRRLELQPRSNPAVQGFPDFR